MLQVRVNVNDNDDRLTGLVYCDYRSNSNSLKEIWSNCRMDECLRGIRPKKHPITITLCLTGIIGLKYEVEKKVFGTVVFIAAAIDMWSFSELTNFLILIGTGGHDGNAPRCSKDTLST